MSHRFFVTGDEWGLVDIVPGENAAHIERVKQQYADHHKDTVFSPYGWTTSPFLIPAPEVSIVERQILVADLAARFAGVLERADVVDTCVDFTGPKYEATDCVAWFDPLALDAGVYADVANGIVKTLHLSDRLFSEESASSVAAVLARLGSDYRLMLVSHGNWSVDLADQEKVQVFLTSGEHGFDDPAI